MTHGEKPGVGVADLAGRNLGTRICSYDERDVILYALAVGARASELELVYEERLQALPTFALPLGLWAVSAAGSLGAYDPAMTLHVGQELRCHAPLRRKASVETRAVIEAVWDKGSAALVEIGVQSEYFDTRYTIYVRGAGGFGGPRGSAPAGANAPERPPDAEAVFSTSEDQAALYRLTGDRHPVHIDPEAARAAGFSRPILHGLCTLGGVTLALARATGRPPGSLEQLQARLSAPVLPGDRVGIAAWSSDDSVSTFHATVGTGTVVTSGQVRFAARSGPWPVRAEG